MRTRVRSSRLQTTRRPRPALCALACLIVAGGCAWPSPERQLLLDYFHACRLYDLTVLERLSVVPCNPEIDGVVQGFEVRSVEQLTPVSRKVSIQAAVRMFDGSSTDRAMTITLEQRGTWMVTSITPPPASQTSPAVSSAPPN